MYYLYIALRCIASRLGLVRYIAALRPHAFVYAGVRDVTNAAVLEDCFNKYHGCISFVKCMSADVEGNAQMAQEMQANANADPHLVLS